MSKILTLYTSEAIEKALDAHPRRADFRSRNAFFNAILASFLDCDFPLKFSGKNRAPAPTKERMHDYRGRMVTETELFRLMGKEKS
jgi:hypothetical protein